MADVRSMLRNERANRRITHPHLTYSTTGALTCIVCHVQIKSEALWNKHLHSPQHVTSLQEARKIDAKGLGSASATVDQTPRFNGSKKRKADDDSSEDDMRKRSRDEVPGSAPTVGDSDLQGATLAAETRDATEPLKDRKRKRSMSPEIAGSRPKPPRDPVSGTNGSNSNASHAAVSPVPQNPHPNPTIDEDEWAAFQRDIATPAPEPSALTATADISAAPMSAADLAAQSREQASTQAKERMEAEIEGEKEDAARQMEEEFEEMAELEERVRRLKEKREKLRVKEAEGEWDGGGVEEGRIPPEGAVGAGLVEDSGGDDEDEIDEWAGWGR
ncbi:MAG: hypothetical protein Q9179_005742 [Wetmoreana sp. 5 TL-2023]